MKVRDLEHVPSTLPRRFTRERDRAWRRADVDERPGRPAGQDRQMDSRSVGHDSEQPGQLELDAGGISIDGSHRVRDGPLHPGIMEHHRLLAVDHREEHRVDVQKLDRRFG